MPRVLSRTEFVALMAMLFATIAFSIDAMLPALPEIADELSPEAPNRAQLILTSFVLGMGVGTMFTGPLSDAFGRKPVIVGGAILYTAASALAWAAQSLELILVARVLQGLGAAGPRVTALAIIRDLYEGRRMAQLMSFVMLVFTLVPAMAPTLGAFIIWGMGWRGIFLAFILFSVISTLWLGLRQSETLPPDRRRPFRAGVLWAGIVEVMTNRVVILVIAALSLTFGALFSLLSTIQPIFDVTFGEGHRFHWWFMLIALIAATGSILNARIVMAMGMRRVAAGAFLAQAALSAGMVAVSLAGPWDADWAFVAFVGWAASLFFMVGLTVGNLNALGMVPMGHIAGMAASIIGSVATVVAVLIAIPVGLAFDGTPMQVALGTLICTFGSFLIVRSLGDPQPDTTVETGP